jgi:hypothetical protein
VTGSAVEVVDDVPEPGAFVDIVDAPLDTVVDEPTTVVAVEPGIVVGAALTSGAAVVEVVVDEFGLSGEVQPAGGTPAPVCPGMRIVPAQPKFEKLASNVTVPPSEKVSVDLTWRMKPAASIETTALLEV